MLNCVALRVITKHTQKKWECLVLQRGAGMVGLVVETVVSAVESVALDCEAAVPTPQ